MVKFINKNEWKALEIDGSVFKSGIEGLIGIEECTDYNLEDVLSSKKGRRNKRKAERVDSKNKARLSEDEISTTKKVKKNEKITDKTPNVKKKRKDKVRQNVTNFNIDKNVVNRKEIKGKINSSKKNINLIDNDSDDESDNDLENDFEQSSDSENVDTELKMHAWSIVPLPAPIIEALALQKFESPTEIQALTLPPAILGRRDILGAAETGSGKTLAFGIPIISGILKLKEKALEESEEDNIQLDLDKFVEDDLVESGDSQSETVDTDEEVGGSDEEAVDSDKEAVDSDEEAVDSDEEVADDALYASDEEKNRNSESEFSDFDETEEQVEGVDDEGIGCVRSINNVQFEDSKVPIKPLYALILTPTRELAVQIKNHLIAAAQFTDIRVAVVVGGMAAVKQERVLSKGPEIVVATPGRLWELIQLGNRHLSQVDDIRYLAIDETDRMVEKGHFQELHHLLERINRNEAKKQLRQNFVFSATLTLVHELPRHLVTKKIIKIKRHVADMTASQKLQKVIEMLGITNPKIVDITKEKGTPGSLTECRITCPIDQKDFYVYYFLQKHPGRTLIFCNSIGCVKRLTTLLSLLNCSPLPLHASMQQRQRLRNLDRFRDRENSILVATDVAARGLDIPAVEHVLHYQTPRTSESYVHRSGRTARASREGITVLLVEPSELNNYLRLCRTLGKTEDIPMFPVQANYLNAVKQRVNLAVQLDKLELQVKKANSEVGWFQKAADEMDIVVDDVSFKYDMKEAQSHKKSADIHRKQLTLLLQKPIFPKGFSGRYPMSGNAIDLAIAQGSTSTETAIEAMKNSLVGGTTKKQTRKNPKILFKQRIKKSNEVVNAKELMRPKQRGKGNKKGSPGKRLFRKNKK